MSIGGGEADESVYAAMASDWNRRQAFITSSISLARPNNFHGLDLDWEYPTTQDQMTQFGYLVDEWRTAVTDEARTSGKPRLLLAAAVFFNSTHEKGAKYVIPALESSLDWINVMGYDFYAPNGSDVTGPPGALYNPWKPVSADSGVRAWIDAGFPANKIVLGFPFIGYGWTLSDPANNGYFAPTTGAAFPSNGALTYQKIKEFIANNSTATAVFDSAVVNDYWYSGTTWIGYDDTQSIETKVRYIKEKGLRGYFAWHIGGDDNVGLSQTASRTGSIEWSLKSFWW